MYGNPLFNPIYTPQIPAFILPDSLYRFPYPTVNPKIFAQSIRSFRLLMTQGNRLLDRLSDPGFANRVMEAAQQGKKRQVESLIKSLDLRVPVRTQYNPSGIIFILSSDQSQHSQADCCTLTIPLKWGL